MNKYVLLIISLLTACASPEQPVKQIETRVTPPTVPTVPTIVAPKQPPPDIRGFRQTTYATWYQIAEHGNPTADGDVYDYYAMTAAHQNLPLGSQVRVRYLATGQNIIVTINDRMPTPAIKLSTFAAKQLGVWGTVNPKVSIEGLSVKRVY